MGYRMYRGADLSDVRYLQPAITASDHLRILLAGTEPEVMPASSKHLAQLGMTVPSTCSPFHSRIAWNSGPI